MFATLFSAEPIRVLKHLLLKNVGPAAEMAVEFGPRINLITGDNGLGKSFLLDVAWWALTRKWPRDLNRNLNSGYLAKPTNIKNPATIEFSLTTKTLKTIEYSSSYSVKDESWLGKAGRPWNPGLVIYAHADGSFSVWDPARNYWKTKGNIDVQERLPGYVFSPQEVWDGLEVDFNSTRSIVCNGLLRDWASWIKSGGIEARNMAAVLKILSASSEESDILRPGPLTRIGINDSRDIPSIKTGYADSVPVLFASSGVKRIVALAYMFLWSWQEHRLASLQIGDEPTQQVVLLIDELESHLHPKWQRAILPSLLELANVLHQKAQIQVITATHSPLVMASAESTFNDQLDAWFDIDFLPDQKAGRVELRKRDFQRLGDVSAWLTSEAFDVSAARSIEAENATREAMKLAENAAPTKAEIDRVDRLLRAALSDTDRFWVRWVAFKSTLKQRGKK